MVTTEPDLWHQVHAQREDGVPAMFQVRELAPRLDQPQIFMIEMPYEISDASKLPDEAAYLRLDDFQEKWVEPACEALGWTFVAWKSEDGAFSLYLYGSGDPNALLERLAPFDEALGFYNEADPAWSEYAALHELVEQAEVADGEDDEDEHVHSAECDHDHEHGEDDEEAREHAAEAPARSAARARAKKPAAKKAAAPRPAARKPTAKASDKPAAKKPAAKKPAAKRAAKKPAAGATKPAAKKPPAKAAKKPAAKKPAAKPAAKKPATKPAKKPAKKPAAKKPARKRR